MEKFCICAKNPQKADDVRARAETRGFVYAPREPDFIITLGGDGTLLRAERQRPGTPKLPVRDSLICFKCHDERLEEMLDIIRRGEVLIDEMIKLEALTEAERILATNDVVVRNKDPRHALRFRLSVEGRQTGEVLIGDGVVVATPFGSTGYYRSVTGESLEEGIGLAFNNLAEAREPLHLAGEAEVKLEVVRGEAHLSADNHPKMQTLSEGDSVTVSRAPEKARLVGHM